MPSEEKRRRIRTPRMRRRRANGRKGYRGWPRVEA
jgi:hypothetical protein